MDFIDQLKQFASRLEKTKDNILTEEATKTSMIMPFFQMLGYDVFNPLEFVPEYNADFGTKKGEKVDYAIMDPDGNPTILIEAKFCGENLDKHGSQLFRYYSTTPAKFGILTNGITYQFFTDLEDSNKMDEKPFLEFNLFDIKDSLVPEIKKFQKTSFDVETIFNTASDLKYSNQIKQILSQQLSNPSDDFTRCIINDFYEGVKTQNVIEKFRSIVKKTLAQFINEQINDRLKSALDNETPLNVISDDSFIDNTEQTASDISKIVTTEEEIESFYIIKSILRETLGSNRINYKDTESYFGILLNNNTRKWICRIQISDNRIRFILPDEDKNYITHQLESLDDLYSYKEDLVSIVERYII